jgi:thiamine kinase-like enzyme
MIDSLTPAASSVETAELVPVLDRILSRRPGVLRHIAGLRRQPSCSGSSFAVETLDIVLDDGTELSLIFKDLSERALLPCAREVKPRFVYDPLREIETYRSILSQHALGTAAYYGDSIEPAGGRYWLFLENVPARMLWQVGELDIWLETARWLGQLHDLFVSQTELDERAHTAHWLQYHGDYYRLWMQRALSFVRGPAAARRGLQQLAQSYETAIQRLLALPVTFIHGEFYASNVLVHQDGEPSRICPIDWEMAAVAPGLMDLAALCAGKWSAEQRTALAHAYRAATHRGATRTLEQSEFLAGLDLCALHCAVQWLGWSRDWVPPPEQAHDWLAEALNLAEKLELL